MQESVVNNLRRIAASLVAVHLCACAPSQNEELREELIEMVRVDQLMRERLIAAMADMDFNAPPTEEWIALVAEQDELDEANGRRLEEIVDAYGWPTFDLVGREASSAAQVILEHGSVDRKRRLFPAVEKAVADGQALASDLAMLQDSLLIADGKKQIYGTEVVNGPNGEMMLYPLEDPDSVDERRESVGLPPLEEYLEVMERGLGRPIVR